MGEIKSQKPLTYRQERILRKRVEETVADLLKEAIARVKEMPNPMPPEVRAIIEQRVERIRLAQEAVDAERDALIEALISEAPIELPERFRTELTVEISPRLRYRSMGVDSPTAENVERIVLSNVPGWSEPARIQAVRKKVEEWQKALLEKIDSAVLFGVGVESLFDDAPTIESLLEGL